MLFRSSLLFLPFPRSKLDQVAKHDTSAKRFLKDFSRYHGLPKKDAVFFNQSDLIVEMAKKEDFIVMGRCADVILTNNRIPHISIFITAPFEQRVRRMMEVNNLPLKEAVRRLKKNIHKHKKEAYCSQPSWFLQYASLACDLLLRVDIDHTLNQFYGFFDTEACTVDTKIIVYGISPFKSGVKMIVLFMSFINFL